MAVFDRFCATLCKSDQKINNAQWLHRPKSVSCRMSKAEVQKCGHTKWISRKYGKEKIWKISFFLDSNPWNSTMFWNKIYFLIQSKSSTTIDMLNTKTFHALHIKNQAQLEKSSKNIWQNIHLFRIPMTLYSQYTRKNWATNSEKQTENKI